MNMSYCFGWILIMNYEQLFGSWDGVVIKEPSSCAESSESSYVGQQDP